MAIGDDGRGVQIGVRSLDSGPVDKNAVDLALLERRSRSDARLTGTYLDDPSLDVGRSGVSQLVLTQNYRVNGAWAVRTVVRVRR